MIKHLTSFLLIIFSTSLLAQEIVWSDALSTSLDEQYNDVVVDTNGNLYNVGVFDQSITIDGITLTSHGGADMFISKYDKDHNLLWARNLGSTLNDWTYPTKIAVDNDGNLYIYGIHQSTFFLDHITLGVSNSKGNAFLAKYNTDGIVQWAKRIATNTNYKTIDPAGLTIDSTGRPYIAGHYAGGITLYNTPNVVLTNSGNNDSYIAKYNTDGSIAWVEHITTTSEANLCNITYSSDGFIVAIGYVSQQAFFDNITVYTGANNGGFVARYDLDGTAQWANDFGINALPVDIECDSSNGIYITGQFSGTNFIGGTLLSSSDLSNFDMFIMRMTKNGQYLWSTSINGPEYNHPQGLATGDKNSIYVAGSAQTSLTVGDDQINNLGTNSNYFVVKIDSLGSPLWVKTQGTSANTAFVGDRGGIYNRGDGYLYLSGDFYGQTTLGTDSYTSQGTDAFTILIRDTLYPIPVITSVDSKNNSSLLTAYPNPFSNKITFSISNLSTQYNLELLLYDVYGTEVYRDHINSNGNEATYTLYSNELVNGIYFYKVYSSNNIINSGKVILNK